jgi:hypothetical protein
MKNLIIAALLLFSTAAFATNKPKEPDRTQPVSYDQDQDQGQHQGQGQAQGQGQGQAQGQAQQANAAAAASASNHTAVGVGVGVDTRDTNHNTDINNVRAEGGDSYSHGGVQGQQQANTSVNTNTAAGGRGGEGGTGVGFGGNQAQQQGISDSGNSQATGGSVSDSGNSTAISASRGGDQQQTATGGSVTGSGNSSAVNQGNNAAQSTNVTFEAAEIPKHTPDATAPGIYTSNSCAQGFGAGASGPGYGLSVGGNKIDKGCTVRENARILAGVDSALAIEYLCRNKHVDIGETLGELCKPKLVPEPPVVIYPEPEPPVTVIVEDVKG